MNRNFCWPSDDNSCKSKTIIKRIVLIGPMGSGKTTVGSLLAKQLNFKFLDTDRRLEKVTGASISLIFDIEGEKGFRKRENKVVRDLLDVDRTVVATGGGSILDQANRINLRENSIVIYLRGKIETLTKRTRTDKNRPLLNTLNPNQTITELLNERSDFYEETADFRVDVDDIPAEKIVLTIRKLLP